MICTPQDLMVLAGLEGYSALNPPLTRDIIIQRWHAIALDPTILIPVPPGPPFDPTACAITTLTNGGGDLFDCYEVATLTPSYFTGKDGGTNWSGVWIFAHNQFGEQFGDTFESYPDGAAGTLGGGTGFTGNWGHD